MKKNMFLLFFRIFKSIKNQNATSALGRTTFELNSAAIVEFSSIEVGNSVTDFIIHPEKNKIK